MSYRHGAFFDEAPTSLVTPVEVDSALPVVIGTAPVHNLPDAAKGGPPAPVNEPRLIYTVEDFVAQFGGLKDGEAAHNYTLTEFVNVFIGRYNVAPVVCINVFDPARHLRPGESADDAGASGNGQTAEGTPESGLAGSDGRVPVAGKDIIGGVNESGKSTGLALVDRVFPLFRKVPGLILAPGFSSNPAVAIAIGAACENISGHFRAVGVADLPGGIARPEDAPAWVNDNNLTDENLLLFFGTPVYDNAPEYGSTHLAAVMARRDAENDGIPFWSPSNRRMLCQGLTHNCEELALTPLEAANLNGNGIVTGLNMVGGMVAWGDQTACYPGVTDVKDASIPIRRMFNWIGNTLVLTAWQKVSNPLRRRLISSICDTCNIWLNGLVAREFILGGRVTFEARDNSSTDLMAGKVRFHVHVTPPTAAREIVFTLEYDPAYLETLFESAV
ncbi:phage tail sheath protein [Desulfovibrio sp. ZJ369]|uniref:phage tail sheath family protein n=1 Tax=Desulfovibrio sp. ZJ369 TaxID=2709793 RepID=UPI0013EDCC1B|nr:phage tail sheath protein [Desulfovibrio sp. ZJ369]